MLPFFFFPFFFLTENVKIVLERVDREDPLVKEGQEMRKVRYQGTPMAIYRHIILAEIKDATASLPPVSLKLKILFAQKLIKVFR